MDGVQQSQQALEVINELLPLTREREYVFLNEHNLTKCMSENTVLFALYRVGLFALAPSLGGVESLVTQSCTSTRHGLTSEERVRLSISDAMLRLSIGLEDAEDLTADLNKR